MRIIKTTALNSTPFVEFNETEYEDTTGAIKKWNWIGRVNERKAVVIVAFSNNDGEELLVVTKEFRVPLGGYEWGCPAGLVDNDENPVVTATRELKEETGLDVERIRFVSPFVYNSAGITNESISIVVLDATGEVNKDLLEDSEDITTFLMTKDEVDDLINDPTKKIGAKAWVYMRSFIDGDL